MRRSRLWPPKRHSYMARKGGRTLVGRGAEHNVPLPSSYTRPRCAVNMGESVQGRQYVNGAFSAREPGMLPVCQ